MPHRKNRIFTAITVALTLASCNRSAVFDHYMPVDVAGWHRTDTIATVAAPLLTTAEYEEEVSLRITDGYQFKNLSIIVEQEIKHLSAPERNIKTYHKATSKETDKSLSLTEENMVFRDTLAFNLEDNGNSSITYSNHTIPLRSLRLAYGDTIAINIRHYMMQETLRGIDAIGVRITEK